jgi:hypothetical protein
MKSITDITTLHEPKDELGTRETRHHKAVAQARGRENWRRGIRSMETMTGLRIRNARTAEGLGTGCRFDEAIENSGHPPFLARGVRLWGSCSVGHRRLVSEDVAIAIDGHSGRGSVSV